MNKLAQFSVSVYGKLEKYNDVISKARCRIFYKYANRNGGYITDEFADKLLSTVAYAPVKGIYEVDDYTDHGKKRTEGRIYGIVPENPNLAWEDHIDEDGVTRTYACVDVLIYTGLYEAEASQIVGKAQSMELYGKSIIGNWQFINGKRYYVYTDACFLGLQILGEDVEPCFEGAAFFSKIEDLQKVLETINKISNTFELDEGENKMEIKFKISDDQKHDMLWTLLNSSFNEENDWVVEYAIGAVYDDYALVYKYEDGCNYRAYYSKDDENDSLSITNMEKCFVIDVNEQEKAAIDSIKTMNNGTYEKIDEKFSQISVLEKNNTTYSQQIEELTEQKAAAEQALEESKGLYITLENNFNETKQTLAQLQSDYSLLKTDNETLTEFKNNIEKAEKEEIIDTYSNKLDEDVLESYRSSIEKYTSIELEKELAYEYVKANPVVPEEYSYRRVPNESTPSSGLAAILSKYKK